MSDPDLKELLNEKPESNEVRRLKQELAKRERSLAEYRAGKALVVDALRDILTKEPIQISAPPRPPRSKKKRQEVAVIHVSDTQGGKVTKSYNLDVMRDRLLELADKACRAVEDRRSSARIETCHLYLGGDLVEGEEIFAHQAWEVEASVLAQAVRHVPTALADMTVRLLETFPTIRVVGVVGNHGRPGKKGSNASPQTNWDRVCMEVYRLLLQSMEKSGRIKFNLSDDWCAVDDVLGWSNLLIHGDQVRGGFAGFPWYAVGRRAGGWKAAVKDWKSREGNWRRYLWLGHFHTYAGPVVMNDVIMLANGTTESDNEYARSELASAGEPCQRVAFFDEEHGLIADHQVFLS